MVITQVKLPPQKKKKTTKRKAKKNLKNVLNSFVDVFQAQIRLK